jgi:hypothetical protein
MLEGEDLENCKDLVATTFLSMATCYFLLENYPKCIEKATLSIKQRPTIDAYYRRGKGYALFNDFDSAIKDF